MIALLRRLRDDRGLSLPELLTTMVLLGVVGTMVVLTVSRSTATIVGDQARLDNLNTATVGINQLTKAIRAGTEIERLDDASRPVFRVAEPERMTFHSYAGDTPALVTFEVNAQRELIETRVPADASGSSRYWTFTGTPTSRVVARKPPIRAAGDPALFTYLAYPEGNREQLALSSSPTETELRRIEGVEIRLTVQTDDRSRVPAAVLVNEVRLPNVGVVRH